MRYSGEFVNQSIKLINQQLVGDSSITLHDRLYAAMMRSTLAEVHVTDSRFVTDALLRHLSRTCPLLRVIDVQGCSLVSVIVSLRHTPHR